MSTPGRPDPTRVTDQAALRSSSGTTWLVWGGVTTVIVAAVMVLMATRSATVGWTCFGLVLAAYAAMVVVRATGRGGRGGRGRLLTLACLDGVIVLVGLVGVVATLADQTL